MSNSSAFDYKLIRSARRTLSVSVSPDNVITVRSPYNVPQAEIIRFLNAKKGWIEANLNKNSRLRNVFGEVMSGRTILVCGREVGLCVDKAGIEGIFNGSVRVHDIKNLKKVYVSALGDQFLKMAESIASRCGMRAASWGFRSYRSRWGCCDGENRITFNYKILMLPERLQTYIIVHELCHTRRRDHSPAFNRLVLSVLPQKNVLERELKDYSFLARMY